MYTSHKTSTLYIYTLTTPPENTVGNEFIRIKRVLQFNGCMCI